MQGSKCELFRKEVIYCGLHVSERGVSVDPARTAALRALPPPKTVGDVWHFMSSVGWIRRDIPMLSVAEATLTSFVTDCLARTKRRDMKAAQRIQLHETHWGPEHDDAWQAIRRALLQTITTSHRDRRQVACVFTDASEHGWSYAITQCQPGELEKPWAEQKHELLAVGSGTFRHAQKNWNMSCKEAFLITAALTKHPHLLQGNPPWASINDHKSLLHIFNGPLRTLTVPKPARGRLARWATFLRTHNFTKHHIPGADNMFCDLFSRNGCQQAVDWVDEMHERIQSRHAGPVAPKQFAILTPDAIPEEAKVGERFRQGTST